MGPQGPPVPCASLHTNGAALRGRVPPIDYRDNPRRSPKSRAAAGYARIQTAVDIGVNRYFKISPFSLSTVVSLGAWS